MDGEPITEPPEDGDNNIRKQTILANYLVMAQVRTLQRLN